MHLYINELSLEDQFHTMNAFILSLREIYLVLDSLANMDCQKHVFHSDLIWQKQVINTEIFSQAINKLPDKSLRTAFINIFKNKLNSQSWENNRQHLGTDNFVCKKCTVTNASLAEIAEATKVNPGQTYLLLSFADSKFSKHKMRVLKRGSYRIFVINVTSCDDFGSWAISNHLVPPPYLDTATQPPRDFHTALSDSTRFKKTQIPAVQGRTVYEEIATSRYCYVDNKHFGQGAHLEVFDHNRKHLGKAGLNGQLIPGSAEKDRTF